MKKAYRIKKEREFQHVYHHAQTYANRQLVLYVYPKPEQAHFRVGLSVGKRIGNAVMRNKVKRYLRQSLQDLENMIIFSLLGLILKTRIKPRCVNPCVMS